MWRLQPRQREDCQGVSQHGEMLHSNSGWNIVSHRLFRICKNHQFYFLSYLFFGSMRSRVEISSLDFQHQPGGNLCHEWRPSHLQRGRVWGGLLPWEGGRLLWPGPGLPGRLRLHLWKLESLLLWIRLVSIRHYFEGDSLLSLADVILQITWTTRICSCNLSQYAYIHFLASVQRIM